MRRADSPQIFSGASSSRRMGWLRKISLDFRHRPRISPSVSWTFFPGREPLTGRQFGALQLRERTEDKHRWRTWSLHLTSSRRATRGSLRQRADKMSSRRQDVETPGERVNSCSVKHKEPQESQLYELTVNRRLFSLTLYSEFSAASMCRSDHILVQ